MKKLEYKLQRKDFIPVLGLLDYASRVNKNEPTLAIERTKRAYEREINYRLLILSLYNAAASGGLVALMVLGDSGSL